MCGLFGAFGTGLTYVDKTVFNEGMIVSSLRGMHSTGVGIFGRTQKGLVMSYYKKALPSQLLIGSQEYQEWFRDWYDPQVLLGHCRHATQGERTHDNAHPFIHNHVLLTHNGTIHNKDYVSMDKKFDVDSEAICYSVSKRGLLPTLRAMSGAYTLAYFDMDQREVNIIRNQRRPLYYAEHKTRKAWYYASEAGMLSMILERNNVDYLDIEELPVDHLLKWSNKPGEKETFSVDKIELYPKGYSSRKKWAGGGRNDDDDKYPIGNYGWSAGGFDFDKVDDDGVSRDLPDLAPKVEAPPPKSQPAGGTTITTTSEVIISPQTTEGRVSANDMGGGRIVRDSTVSGHPIDKAYYSKLLKFRTDHNLNYGEWVVVWLTEFTPYNGRSPGHLGIASGMVMGLNAPVIKVKVMGFDTSKFKQMYNGFKQGEYRVQFTSMLWDKVADLPMIGCNNPVSYDPEKDSNLVKVWNAVKTEAAPGGAAKEAPKSTEKAGDSEAKPPKQTTTEERWKKVSDFNEAKARIKGGKPVSAGDYRGIVGPDGRTMEVKEYVKIADKGCLLCDGQISLIYSSEQMWSKDTTKKDLTWRLVCEKCCKKNGWVRSSLSHRDAPILPSAEEVSSELSKRIH